ncbi:MAG: hypothetical protein AB2A00_18180 [Myxococcota bacterium]
MAATVPFRQPIELVVTLKYASLDEFDVGFAPCVGAEVVFFKTKATKPVGTLVRLELKLRDGQPALVVEGQVLWAVGPDRLPRGRTAGMGIHCTPCDEPSAQRLRQILKVHGEGELARVPGAWALDALSKQFPRAARRLGSAAGLSGTDALGEDLDDAFTAVMKDGEPPPPPQPPTETLLQTLAAVGSSVPVAPPLAPPREPEAEWSLKAPVTPPVPSPPPRPTLASPPRTPPPAPVAPPVSSSPAPLHREPTDPLRNLSGLGGGSIEVRGTDAPVMEPAPAPRTPRPTPLIPEGYRRTPAQVPVFTPPPPAPVDDVPEADAELVEALPDPVVPPEAPPPSPVVAEQASAPEEIRAEDEPANPPEENTAAVMTSLVAEVVAQEAVLDVASPAPSTPSVDQPALEAAPVTSSPVDAASEEPARPAPEPEVVPSENVVPSTDAVVPTEPAAVAQEAAVVEAVAAPEPPEVVAAPLEAPPVETSEPPLPPPVDEPTADGFSDEETTAAAAARIPVAYQFTVGRDPRTGMEPPLVVEPIYWPLGDRTKRELPTPPPMDEAAFARTNAVLHETFDSGFSSAPPPLPGSRVIEEPAGDDPWAPAPSTPMPTTVARGWPEDGPTDDSGIPPIRQEEPEADVFASLPGGSPRLLSLSDVPEVTPPLGVRALPRPVPAPEPTPSAFADPPVDNAPTPAPEGVAPSDSGAATSSPVLDEPTLAGEMEPAPAAPAGNDVDDVFGNVPPLPAELGGVHHAQHEITVITEAISDGGESPASTPAATASEPEGPPPAPTGPAALVQGIGIALPGGRLRRVLHPGAAIPAQWSKVVPGTRGSGALELELHESPSDRVADGQLLGKVTLKPPRPDAGLEWHVDMSVDADAVLVVTAYPTGAPDVATERCFALENTTSPGRARVARSQRDLPEQRRGSGGLLSGMKRLIGR